MEVEHTQALEYNDHIGQYFARLEQRMNAYPKQDSQAQMAPIQGTERANADVIGTTRSQKLNVKLPRIELVKFSGQRHEWQVF